MPIIRSYTKLQDILQRDGAWWSYYQKNHETIRETEVDNIVKVMSCGRFIKGYRKYCCSDPDCTHTTYVTQSCNSRSCPTCGKRATDQWILKQQDTLPHCDWQHITFTIPKPLWILFHKHRDILNLYAKLAADVIQKAAKKKGILVGIFIAIHTAGRDLQWHPHIHLSVTMGGICEKTDDWKPLRFSKKMIMPMWRYAVISMFRRAKNDGLIDCDNALLTKQYNRPWIIHCSKPTNNPWPTISYLGRYLKRPPIAMSRLIHYDGKRIVFDYLNHRLNKHQTLEMDIDHFLYLFIQHIPEKNFRLIRYYGFLANRVRTDCLKKVYKLLEQEVSFRKYLTWRQSKIKEFGEDPLKCLLCGSSMLFVEANPGMSHKKIMKHQKALALRQLIA